MLPIFKSIEILTDEDLAQLARMIDSRYVGKVVFECSVCPNPEKIWAGDTRMIRYSYARQEKLIDLGVADDNFFSSIRERNDSSLILAIEIDTENLSSPLIWFEMVMRMQLVDVYLFKNGELIAKYD